MARAQTVNVWAHISSSVHATPVVVPTAPAADLSTAAAIESGRVVGAWVTLEGGGGVRVVLRPSLAVGGHLVLVSGGRGIGVVGPGPAPKLIRGVAGTAVGPALLIRTAAAGKR